MTNTTFDVRIERFSLANALAWRERLEKDYPNKFKSSKECDYRRIGEIEFNTIEEVFDFQQYAEFDVSFYGGVITILNKE